MSKYIITFENTITGNEADPPKEVEADTYLEVESYTNFYKGNIRSQKLVASYKTVAIKHIEKAD